MACDRIYDRPWVSRFVLLGGGIVYFFLCWPLYGRRGFPEVDPFWLVMVWMWIPPVIVSAVFCRWSRRWLKNLALYSVIAGFVVCWATVMVVPSYKTPLQAGKELLFFWPFMMFGACLLDLVSRFFLAFIRLFAAKLHCTRCGYSLQGLSVARCPECGTEFPDVLLQEDYEPKITPVFRRWTTLVIAIVVIVSVSLPFGWRRYTFYSLAVAGREAAEQDWASGDVTWYVTQEELQALPADTLESAYIRLHTVDPETGWAIEPMWWGDWKRVKWESAYRETIEQKLKEAGRKTPKFE